MIIIQNPSQACSHLRISLLDMFFDHSFGRYPFGHWTSLLYEPPLLAFSHAMHCNQLGLGPLCFELFGAHISVLSATDDSQEHGVVDGIYQFLYLSQ